MHIYIYIHMYIYTYIFVYVDMKTERRPEREKESDTYNQYAYIVYIYIYIYIYVNIHHTRVYIYTLCASSNTNLSGRCLPFAVLAFFWFPSSVSVVHRFPLMLAGSFYVVFGPCCAWSCRHFFMRITSIDLQRSPGTPKL